MSNLSISNHSGDKKHNGQFPNLFGQNFFEDFFQNVTSHFPFAKELAETSESKLGFVNPKVDITENKKAYSLTAELPGLDNDDIKLELSDGILTLSGKKKYEHEEDKEDNVHVMERSYGSFQRSFRLPTSVEQDQIKAEFKKGVLKITLPKSAKAQEQQRKIEIEG